MMPSDKTASQGYAYIIGLLLLALGVLGFVSSSSFVVGADVVGEKFLFFEVNGWLNLLHAVTGLLGLLVATNPKGAKSYALAIGILYSILAIWGFNTQDEIASLFVTNSADNILHIAIGALGLLVGTGVMEKLLHPTEARSRRVT